jgi:hypothetical protein
MKLRMCICLSQPATSMHAKRHGKGFFFCSRLEDITGLAYGYDFGWPILAALVFARGGSGVFFSDFRPIWQRRRTAFEYSTH